MGTIVLSGTVVLVILGFGNHTWWLVAVALLFVYMQYGRGGASASSSGGSSGGSSGAGSGAVPGSYRAYRDRRDKQARWDRRYRRERPLESRRQARER
ncbi:MULTISPECIES: hypothetical protein [Streptomyces]|uniref:Uncharacterized protein n=1 Tax=Streptomyces sviceus (strain ATCC 29083 / DSM 924 / JCM 4929 / NBRC 13980 / NCIMB 11184 / NRRL 5439 / UC 5370) TaxID=463191 RepID=B5I221_STRX2|nr:MULTISPECIES: hypothetical protein [Streptomyces]EDY59126.1 conserved hypothetical protein [Streptomyces sviceus ATCC 29083]MYT05360.1 hypothetical protein [Streptomyces sp. SID5470]